MWRHQAPPFAGQDGKLGQTLARTLTRPRNVFRNLEVIEISQLQQSYSVWPEEQIGLQHKSAQQSLTMLPLLFRRRVYLA